MIKALIAALLIILGFVVLVGLVLYWAFDDHDD